jgi:putative ABC transport system ATP-binding protein
MIICLKNLVKTYIMGGTPIHALNGISLEINEGEFVSVVGPSGSGKTTLLNMIGALDSPTSGSVILDGTDISKLPEGKLHTIRRTLVGQIYQQFYLIPTLSALENLKVPMYPLRISADIAEEKAEKLLRLVGLCDRIHHKPSELSGGEQQRVAIARALINEPKILLADEPTGNLDTMTGDTIINLLGELNRNRKLTIVLVTHNQRLVKKTQRIIKLQDGKIIDDILNKSTTEKKKIER